MRAAPGAPPLARRLARTTRGLSPRVGRGLTALFAAALALAAAYVLWFRDSSFVRVERVSITGATSDDSPRLRAALVSAARGMTTLHLRPEVLERAAAAFPTVRSVTATADFPHALRIRVVEHRPVAILARGDTPVGADGTLLRGLRADRRLPRLDLLPSGKGRVANAALPLVRVAAAAPPALGARVSRIERRGTGGVIAVLRRGPRLIFGDDRRSAEKWRAAARVLASPAAVGAVYVDVTVPERPVAGGDWPAEAAGGRSAAGPAAGTSAGERLAPTGGGTGLSRPQQPSTSP